MLHYMLDTNICIYVIKNWPAELRETSISLRNTCAYPPLRLENCTTVPRNPAAAPTIAKLSTSLPHGWKYCRFPATPQSITGKCEPNWNVSGRPSGPYDMLIGAYARSEGLIVVTNNIREFERRPGLLIENWV